MQGTWVQSLGWEDPLKEEIAIHSSILAWEIHGGTLLLHINIYMSILCTFITIKLFFKWNAMHRNNKGDFLCMTRL